MKEASRVIKRLCKMLLLFFLVFCAAFTQISGKCYHSGEEFKPGQAAQVNCRPCVCLQSGGWVCKGQPCAGGLALVPSNDLSIKAGSKVYLRCDSDIKRSKFSWFINGLLVTGKSAKISQSSDKMSSSIRIDSKELALPLNRISCVTNPFEMQKTQIRVISEDSMPKGYPKILTEQQIVEASLGDRITLKCPTTGQPTPEIAWFKFGVPVDFMKRGNSLTNRESELVISSVKLADAGLYDCMASNSVGVSTSSAVQLVVNKDTSLRASGTIFVENLSGNGIRHSVTLPPIACLFVSLSEKKIGGKEFMSRTVTSLKPDPSSTPGRYKYTAVITPRPPQGSYRVKAILNIGWCAKGKPELRAGDASTQLSMLPVSVEVQPDSRSIDVDLLSVFSRVANMQLRAVSLSGTINYGSSATTNVAIEKLTADSCLRIGVIPTQNCDTEKSCSNSSLKTFKQLQTDLGTFFRYKMEIKDVKPGKYISAALLQTGSCDSGLSAYKLVNEKSSGLSSEFEIKPTTSNVKNHKMMMAFERKIQKLSGVVRVSSPVDELPAQSCLTITVTSDIQCHGPFDCQPVKSVTLTSPKLVNSTLPYEILLHQPLDFGMYLINAIVNKGWCPTGKDSVLLRPGDFETTERYRLFLFDDTDSDFNMDFTAHLFTRPKPGRDLDISGAIKLHPEISAVPSFSCLSIQIQELSKCEKDTNCKRPFFVEKFIREPRIKADSAIPYDLKLRNVTGKNFSITAVLNSGWCKSSVKGNKQVGQGDFHSIGLNVFEADERQKTVAKDFTIHLFGEEKVENERKVSLDFSLRQTSPAAEIPRGSCLSVRDVNQHVLESVYLRNLTFSSSGITKMTLIIVSKPDLDHLTLKAILNVGWCSENAKNDKIIRNGDYLKEFSSADLVDVIYLDEYEDEAFNVVEELKSDPCKNKTCRFNSKCQIGTDSQPSCVCTPGCPLIYKPVCGTDDKSYDNQCLMEYESCSKQTDISVKSKGKCKEPKPKPGIGELTAHKDPCKNKTCQFYSKCQIGADGQPSCVCTPACPLIYKPVCGTDDKSYANQCLMEFEACSKQTEIVVKTQGECKPKPDPCKNKACKFYSKCKIGTDGQPSCSCSSACPLIYKPVCGSDDEDYANQCLMEYEACKKQTEIVVKSQGECSKNRLDTVTLKLRLSAEGSRLPIPKDSCLSLDIHDASFFDTSPLLKSFIFRTNEWIEKGYFEASLRFSLQDTFELKLVSILSVKHCSNVIYYGDYTGEMMFEVEEEKFNYDVDLKLKKNDKSSLLPCESVQCAYNGECYLENNKTKCRCPRCPFTFSPVCASDRVTYTSACAMRRTSCRTQKELSVLFSGNCEDVTMMKGEMINDESKPSTKDCSVFRIQGKSIESLFPLAASNMQRTINSVDVDREDKKEGSEDSENKRRPFLFNAMEYLIMFPNEANELMNGSIVLANVGSCPTGLFELSEELKEKSSILRNETENTVFSRYSFKQGCNCFFNSVCKHTKTNSFVCSCIINCSERSEPVCGSDGVTYRNLCTMKSESCFQRKDVKILHRGRCAPSNCQNTSCPFGECTRSLNGTEVCQCPEKCPKIAEHPICASNRKTYESACERRRESCLTKTHIYTVRNGVCEMPNGVNSGTLYPDIFRSEDTKDLTPTCLILKSSSEGVPETSFSDMLDFLVKFRELLSKPFHYSLNLPQSREGLAKLQNTTFSVFSKLSRQISSVITRVQNREAVDPIAILKSSTITPILNMTRGGNVMFGDCSDLLENEESYKKRYIPIPHSDGVYAVLYDKKCSPACKHYSKCLTYLNGTSQCVCELGCGRNIAPVCASDGKSYPNLCIMKAESCKQQTKLVVDYEGECKPKCPEECKHYSKCHTFPNGTSKCICQLDCERDLDPVCASDGETYDNLCIMKRESCLKKADLVVEYDGECDKDTTMEVSGIITAVGAPRDLAPESCLIIKVEDTSLQDAGALTLAVEVINAGTTAVRFPYKYNVVSLRPEATAVEVTVSATLHVNHCEKQIKNGDFITDTLLPLDLTDRDKPKHNVDVKLVQFEKVNTCKENCRNYAKCHTFLNGTSKCMCQLGCGRNLDPVCASDGKSYDNLCIMKREACLQKVDLVVDYQGECKSKESKCTEECKHYSRCHTFLNGTSKCMCQLGCGRNLDPVCASDGKSYDNLCIMKREACLKKADLVVDYQGECDTTMEVSGIITAVGAPRDLAPESCLIIKVEDTSLQDAGALTLAVEVINVGTTAIRFPYKYNVVSLRPEATAVEVTVSATLHVNHCEKQIKNGDFITDTLLPLDLTDRDKPKHNVDVKLVKFEKDVCKNKVCKYHSKCKVGSDGQPFCECSANCPLNFKPVCGSDNENYANQCLMELVACTRQTEVVVKNQGECVAENPDPCKNKTCKFYSKCQIGADGQPSCVCTPACPLIYKPVCGSDDVTYANQCLMELKACSKQTDISVKNQGECKEPEPKPGIGELRIPEDPCKNKTCKFYSKCQIGTDGQPSCVCTPACPLIYKPVCGTDDKSYDNQCLMEYESCSKQTDISVKSKGKCKEPKPKPGIGELTTHQDPCKNKTCKFHSKCQIGTDGQPSCVCTPACPLIYKSVCGSDDVTYANQCLMEFEACLKQTEIVVKIQGECKEPEPKPGIGEFTTNEDPCKNMTCRLSSKCEIGTDGEPSCVCSRACPMIYDPVCGSDNEDYANQCLMEYEACSKQTDIVVKNKGECKKVMPEPKCTEECKHYSRCHTFSNGTSKCICQLGCGRNLDPVCASDGKSYDNLCIMKRESCLKKANLIVKHEGECKSTCDEECKDYSRCHTFSNGTSKCMCQLACHRNLDPVCASDGKTYANLCIMERESCLRKANLVVKYEGECKSKCNQECKDYSRCHTFPNGTSKCMCQLACHRNLDPVCASDGKSYANLCIMERESCLRKANLVVKYEGECNDICSLQSDPGPCLGYFSSWYFNKESGECEKFNYGGCKGNGNRFDTKKHCMSRCLSPRNATESEFEISDVCKNKTCKYYSKCKVGSNDNPKCVCTPGCPLIYKPVCGSDDKSYDNQCLMEYESCSKQTDISVKSKGKCKEPKPKPGIGELTTHKDPCKNKTCKFYSKCQIGTDSQPSCVCTPACPLIYKPVCGTDDKSYDNQCLMEYESCSKQIDISVKSKGKCKEPKPKPGIGELTTHNDPCKNETCKFYSKCQIGTDSQPSCVCTPACPLIYKPVCGTDDKSYDHQCLMEYESCSKQTDISVKSKGKCKEPKPKPGIGELTAHKDPCKNKKCKFHSKCQIGTDGQPSCVCTPACPLIYKPVCGSDDVTYANQCLMEFEACSKQTDIVVKNQGECKPEPKPKPDLCLNKSCKFYSKCQIGTDGKPSCVCSPACPLIYKPVCGSDDKSYDNQCLMEYESCSKQTDISVKSKGKCKEPKPKPGIGELTARKDPCKNKTCRFYSKCQIGTDSQPSCVCTPACPLIYKPVCGSDDKSYANQCLMEFEACSKQTDISVKNQGECNPKPDPCKDKACKFYSKCKIDADGQPFCVCNLACPLAYNPVCGSDGVSYANQCLMEFEACSEKAEIVVKNQGECKKPKPAKKPCKTDIGDEILDGHIIQYNGVGCSTCRCQDGQIVCPPITCTDLPCVGGILQLHEGDCCPVCVKNTCTVPISMKSYRIGESYFLHKNQTACNVCSCLAGGEFACQMKTCPVPKCENPIEIDSSCCPMCPVDIRCKDSRTGALYKVGEKWSNGEDNGCSKCSCVAISPIKGAIECNKPKCPPLPCKNAVYVKGFCCPTCFKKNPKGPVMSATVEVLRKAQLNQIATRRTSCFDSETSRVYSDGESWQRGCKSSKCSKLGIEVAVVDCPLLACPLAEQFKKNDACCPECRLESQPELFCDSRGLTLVVPRRFLPFAKPSQLIFDNSDCTATDNGTHLILQTDYQSCGTTKKTDNGSFKFKNLARTIELPDAMISRIRLVQIPVVCTVPMKSKMTFSRAFKPRLDVVKSFRLKKKVVEPVPAPVVVMDVSTKDGRKQPESVPIEIGIGEEVFVDLRFAKKPVNDISITADYCYLTPSSKRDSPNRHVLIANGCPVDATVRFLTATGNGRRFSFKSLSFKESKQDGFNLHCDTLTCFSQQKDSLCAKECKKTRRSRAALRTKGRFISRIHLSTHISFRKSFRSLA